MNVQIDCNHSLSLNSGFDTSTPEASHYYLYKSKFLDYARNWTKKQKSIISSVPLQTASRKSTEHYYLGGAMSLLGGQGQAAHLATAPQTPRSYQKRAFVYFTCANHSIS